MQWPATQKSIAQHVEVQARNPAATFENAVAAVIVGTEGDEHGKLTSAATKMLQVFPQFSNDAIIYDNVVRKALVLRGVATARDAQVLSNYLGGVRGQFATQLVDMPDITIFIDGSLKLPVSRTALSKHLWIQDMGMQRFVRNRLLDRALWLIAAETPAEKADAKAIAVTDLQLRQSVRPRAE
ncbi:hypothetical protein J2777_005949 [Paraburkholderia graminis]|uniref:hypothetical protein n=1 Tax=Paraburkholderia graminis TaxID=60548 RepID=UPI002855E53A|nr:hypothetical protein [Paraburkholderia graminis]MDR6472208.1 hypothetical protein [Paraburkholderia graminis]